MRRSTCPAVGGMRKAPVNTEIKMAALSIARKNSKSGLLSVACLARLAGPLNRRDWRGVVVSETGNLAKELQRAMEMTADISGLGGQPETATTIQPRADRRLAGRSHEHCRVLRGGGHSAPRRVSRACRVMAHDPARYRSRLWKQRRAQAFHQSGFQCERCGQPGRLEVHHKVRIADGGADELDNLECLCRRCNFGEHGSKPRRTGFAEATRPENRPSIAPVSRGRVQDGRIPSRKRVLHGVITGGRPPLATT